MTSNHEDLYPAGRTSTEAERLRAQHTLCKTFLGHVLAPLDLKTAGLHILDSGTADGFWLIDLAPQLGPQGQLVGADLASYQSTVALPPNYSFAIQNIKDKWPDDMVGRFDLVHQRFVLANLPDHNAAVAALRRLVLLVKPGGWIQLEESQVSTDAFSSSDSSIDRLWKILGHFLTALGLDPAPSKRVAALLEEAGEGLLGPLQMKTAAVKLGRGALSREVAQAGVTNVMGLIDVVKPALAKLPTPPVSVDELESLRPNCIEQLNSIGGDAIYTGVWAQRLQ